MVENSPTMAFVLSTERKLAMVVKDCVLNRKVYFSGHLKHQPGLSGRRRRIVGIKIKHMHLKRQPGLPGRRSRIVGIKVKHTRLYDHFVSIGIIEISKIKTASLSGASTGPKVFTSPLGTYIADQIKNRETS